MSAATTWRWKSFQSLLGFLMRCDNVHTAERICERSVSIPAGFSDALRPDDVGFEFHRFIVSIPAGFSDALRHDSRIPVLCHSVVSIPAGFSDALRPHDLLFQATASSCFNPCWVF